MIILNSPRMSEEELLSRLAEQITVFENMGFSKPEIKKMLRGIDWVRDCFLQPSMMDCTDKLPKGWKWSQGTKLGGRKGGKKYNAIHPMIFLEIGDDLYIRDFAGTYRRNSDGTVYRNAKGGHIIDATIAVIRDWRKYMACEVALEIYTCWRGSPGEITQTIVMDSFFQWWHSHGEKIYNRFEIFKEVKQ